MYVHLNQFSNTFSNSKISVFAPHGVSFYLKWRNTVHTYTKLDKERKGTQFQNSSCMKLVISYINTGEHLLFSSRFSEIFRTLSVSKFTFYTSPLQSLLKRSISMYFDIIKVYLPCTEQQYPFRIQ